MLLLDEPTNNLDPASREEVLAAIRGYQGAIVLVTHDEGAVRALDPERVLILPDGVEDLWNDAYKPAGVLSGGEKTRLALSILVVSSANVLLLDEPTNNLDPASREEVLAAIRTYAGAIVLVTHDEGAVHALEPDRVLILPDGVEDLWTPDYADLVALA